MKQTPKRISGTFVMGIAATFALVAIIATSCTKSSSSSSPNYASQFVGSWTGTSSCGGNTTFVLAAGSGTNTLTSSGTIGNTGCVKSISETGTASATAFNFPATTFTDNCGLSYTIAFAGSVSGNTMTAVETITGAVNATCTFTGTK